MMDAECQPLGRRSDAGGNAELAAQPNVAAAPLGAHDRSRGAGTAKSRGRLGPLGIIEAAAEPACSWQSQGETPGDRRLLGCGRQDLRPPWCEIDGFERDVKD